MTIHFANFASSTLSSAVQPSDTTISVVDAGSFPSPNFYVICELEILEVTAVNGSALTVVRGQEGTTAAYHAPATAVDHDLTAGSLTSYVNAVATGDEGGGGIAAVVDDTSPELGGNLDMNGFTIAGNSAATLGYVNGVSSSIQTQLNSKAATSGLATVATSGSYTDLTGTPSLATVATSGSYTDLTGTPSLATVATSGSYTDLTGTPSLATVATSGSYDDLSSKPSIPSAQVNSDWSAGSGVAEILNKPSLATVATSGSYTDLTSKPTLGPSSAGTTPLLVPQAGAGFDAQVAIVGGPLVGQISLTMGTGAAGQNGNSYGCYILTLTNEADLDGEYLYYEAGGGGNYVFYLPGGVNDPANGGGGNVALSGTGDLAFDANALATAMASDPFFYASAQGPIVYLAPYTNGVSSFAFAPTSNGLTLSSIYSCLLPGDQPSSAIASVVFATPLATAPYVIFTAAEPGASGIQLYVSNTTTAGFDIASGGGTLTTSVVYTWNYLVLE
jgi:hypothetical protein